MGAIEKGVQLYRQSKGIVDTVNRNGYEWYMNFLGNLFRNPRANWHYFRDRYEGNWPVSRFVWSVTWRTILMVIPVLPALYVLNRSVGVILNPSAWKTNFTKPLAMLGMLGLGALAVTLPYIQFLARPEFLQSAVMINERMLPFAVNAALQAPMAIGILLWGSLLVGAGLMYAGKQVAQAINQHMVGTSTRKHHITNPKPQGVPLLPPLMMKIYKEVRDKTHELKTTLSKDPAAINYIPAIPGTAPWINKKMVNNSIEAAEATIEVGKEFMARCESLMSAQKNNENLNQNEAQDVIVDKPGSASTNTLYRQWCSDMSVVKNQYKADPEVSRLEFVENKITERSKLGS